MDLVPFMYFERQEPGSQLCAQHCLNNILQQKTYTEFDLADIAQKLDQAENAALSTQNQNKKSYNLDDTGFFSISVLERALQVWDLTLVRWRGEAMKPYQDRPEDQTAFILHLSHHWLPLRRFAPNPPHAAAPRRWYNLNSFLPAPEWISPTYLKMFLTQAEQEGYSVFVVRRASASDGPDAGAAQMMEGQGWGDGGIARLPECGADMAAVDLGEPVGRTGGAAAATHVASSGGTTSTDQPTVDIDPSSIAGPSSPPRARRKRQQDLSSDDIAKDPFNPLPSSSSHRQGGSGLTKGFAPAGDVDSDDDEDIPDSEASGHFAARGTGTATDFSQYARHYDDEDAALQAALRASMEDVPTGWEMPDLSKKPPKGRRDLPLPPVPAPAPAQSPPPNKATSPKPKTAAAAPVPAPAPEQNWRVAGAPTAQVKAPAPTTPKQQSKQEVSDAAGTASAPLSPMEELSPDEIRRRRLAKFGS